MNTETLIARQTSAELDRFLAFLKRFTYKPGYTFSAREYLGITHAVHILCRYEPIDSTDPSPVPGKRIVIHTTNTVHLHRAALDEEHFMQEMRRVCNAIEQHETDEWLKLDGKAPFYPH